MQQQSADAPWVFVEYIALFIGAYMHTFYPHLAVINTAPAVLEVNAALADGLYLSAHQFNAALDGFQYKVVVPRLAVIGYLFCALFIDRHRRDLLCFTDIQ